MLNKILKNYNLVNNIYQKEFNFSNQKIEFEMRSNLSKKFYNNYLLEISRHHSIEVMDLFLRNFLKNIRENGNILDIGCGWCWLWKDISNYRPDIKIYALDFVIENFHHAKNILSQKDLQQIYLINDNFEEFIDEENLFDGIWSSQTFQHIGNFDNNFKKVSDLLIENGKFYNFNLNFSIFNKLASLKNKESKKETTIDNLYYLNRNIIFQEQILKKYFKKTQLNYCEYLFHPELKMFFGKKNSIIGKIDSYLVGKNYLKKFARQVLMDSSK